MGTRAKIATVSPAGRFKGSISRNREFIFSLLDDALKSRPDLVCLPEAFNLPGAGNAPRSERFEPIDGPTIAAAARRAREHRCYIICPIELAEGNTLYNTAVILDRNGQVCGDYRKHCPVTTSPDYTELENGITPGREIPVFDLDFGRIAIQICFDLGFAENWQAIANQRARIVFWPSAYDGGFPLWVYAYLHHYYVISSVRTGRSRVIDPCGENLLEADGNPSSITRDINLDYVVSHLDFNLGIPDRIRQKYGARVDVRQHDPGSAHFIVEPVDPAITTKQLQEEFGFESSAEYHDRHRRAYEALRQGHRPSAQNARHDRRPQYGK